MFPVYTTSLHESLEGLNNSLAYSNGELWPCTNGVIQPLVSFLGVEILITFLFLWHNFLSRYARKPIKGSKNSWDSLVSNKHFGQNVGPFDRRPGPGKIGHKNAKAPPLVTSPQENT